MGSVLDSYLRLSRGCNFSLTILVYSVLREENHRFQSTASRLEEQMIISMDYRDAAGEEYLLTLSSENLKILTRLNSRFHERGWC